MNQEKSARGRVCLYRAAPLPAPGNRVCVAPLEPENDSGRNAQIVLRISPIAGFGETAHQVIHLDGPNRKAIRQFVIHSGAETHGEGIV